jgi:hypothetical protein
LGRPRDASILAVATLSVFVAMLAFCGLAFAAGPPQISASWVEGVGTKSVRLFADVDPNGLPTTYYFEYISDAAYQANPEGKRFQGASKTQPKSLSALGASQELNSLNSSLTTSTTYHYRPVAINASSSEGVIGPEHTFTTKSFATLFQLPDGRAWELVSPPDKGGGAIAAPEELFGGGDIQAAAQAPADPSKPLFTYGSGVAFGSAASAPPISQYLARRSPSAWSSENVSTPIPSGAYGDKPDGAPYRVFSADLSRAVIFGGLSCRGGLEACPSPNPPLPGSGAPVGYMTYYLRDSATGVVSSLLKTADVVHSSVAPASLQLTLVAAAPDLSHVVLSSCAALTADAVELPAGPGRCDPNGQNLYEWSAAGLKAINLMPGDTTTTPGAAIAASIGAISSGSRTYWTEAGNLYLREGGQTHQIDTAQGGGGTFQTATPDGAFAFFTKGGHLYRYDALAQAATDLTPPGSVQGVLGSSDDGAYVYFQDATGLRLWHAGTTTTIAKGAVARSSDYPPATGTARVSPDGLRLAFLTDVELIGNDNLDARTKEPDTQVYIYGPAPGGEEKLFCASCSPTGERPKGDSTIPGALANGTSLLYKPRAFVAGGQRLFFTSENSPEEHDTNETNDHRTVPDVFQWEANGVGSCGLPSGCVNLISAGVRGNSATFLDATASGSDVFFLTEDTLAPRLDPGSIDVYDARIGGGFNDPQEEICVGDGCQSFPLAPQDPTPGTLVPNPGNPPLRILGPKKKSRLWKHRHRHRHIVRHKGSAHRRSMGGSR